MQSSSSVKKSTIGPTFYNPVVIFPKRKENKGIVLEKMLSFCQNFNYSKLQFHLDSKTGMAKGNMYSKF